MRPHIPLRDVYCAGEGLGVGGPHVPYCKTAFILSQAGNAFVSNMMHLCLIVPLRLQIVVVATVVRKYQAKKSAPRQ